MQNRSDWKNHAGGEEDWSATSSSMREVPSYQQQKFLQKPTSANRFQYGQDESECLYRRWHAVAAQKQAYTARRPPIYAAAADGSGYYRRYSLDAPPATHSSPAPPPPPAPESIIYYNTKKSAAFIGQPLEDDNIETSATLSQQMLYPQAIDFGFIPSDNVRSGAFYFNPNSSSTQIAGTATADIKIINTEQVVHNLTLFGRFLEVMQSWPLPHVSFTTACILVLLATFISPRLWAENIIFPAFRLSFGTLYPAYASYKAVRTKNVKEYVKWMMYWIVYAFFTCIETFTDIFLAWFPFYYEVKVIIVLWLLSPATKGSSTLYRKFVHPMLTRREQEIDEYLNQAKERGYSAVLQLGTKGVNYATNVIMQTALKGGGNLVQTIRRSYSLSDLSEPDVHRTQDEIDDVVQMRSHQRMLRQRPQAGGIARSASGTRHSTGMYFSEVDVVKGADGFNYNIRSSEDISSGYSSAEPVNAGLSRTSSMTNASKARLKGTRRTEASNEPQQFRTSEQIFYARNPYPMPGFRHFEYENELDDCELLEENPADFDEMRQKCVQILEEVPPEGLGDNCTKEATNVEASFDIENVARNINVDEKSKNEESSSLENEAMQMGKEEKEHLALEEHPNHFGATVGDIIEVALLEEFKDNNSICSNADTFNSWRNSDEDNESDAYSDALPSLADDEEELEEDGERKAINESVQTSDVLEIPKSAFEPKESSETVTQPPVETQKLENVKVSAKELQDTLQEIKDNFRANIVLNTTTITPTTSSTNTSIIEDKAYPTRPLTHNKGRAPPPPLPPRPARSTPASLSTNIVASSASAGSSNSALDAVSSSSRSSSPAPSSKGIFKNLKTNIFRFGSSSSVNDKQLDANVEKCNRATPPFETQL